MPYNTSGGGARQYTDDRTDLTSVLWAGPEFLPSNIITDTANSNSLNHSNKYVKKLIIPPGCPKTLEISFIRYRCGSGMNGEASMLVKRNGSPVYNKDQSSPFMDCNLSEVTFYWNDFREGDEIELFASSHNQGGEGTVFPPLARTYTTNGSIPESPSAGNKGAGYCKIRVW